MNEGHLISKVAKDSIAWELDIRPGDRLLAIDDNEIKDVLDYRYYVNSEAITMLIEKPNGEQWELDIEHDYEDLGIEFNEGLMSDYKSCTNKCIFCFIDQMPPNMRETLYFKDDDSRLSFLQGNYVTLTNMKDSDIDRIIRFRLGPINISVHTTNPDLRVRMLHNRFAGSSLKYLDKLYENDIPMNGQIVMCRGYNDGKELEKTIADLLDYAPTMESLSVVPLGVTKYREGLANIALVDKESACETIDIIEKYQKIAMQRHGIHFVQASDEFYLLAQRPLPEEDRYDGYIQLENGVGMLRLLNEEVLDAIKHLSEVFLDDINKKEHISIATGKLAAPIIKELSDRIMEALPNKTIEVYTIRNDFFGEKITVAGLITATDLIAQLKDKNLGDRLLLSVNMFRSGEEVFLDDLTKADVEKELGINILIVGTSGYDLVHAILSKEYDAKTVFKAYELSGKGEFNE